MAGLPNLTTLRFRRRTFLMKQQRDVLYFPRLLHLQMESFDSHNLSSMNSYVELGTLSASSSFEVASWMTSPGPSNSPT